MQIPEGFTQITSGRIRYGDFVLRDDGNWDEMGGSTIDAFGRCIGESDPSLEDLDGEYVDFFRAVIRRL